GVTSAGSGALIALGLILVFRLTPHRVVGTDVFHAAILLWVAGAAHFASGNVDVGLALNILIGSVPGVWIGSKVAMRLPAGGRRPASCSSRQRGGGTLRRALTSPLPPSWPCRSLSSPWSGSST